MSAEQEDGWVPSCMSISDQLFLEGRKFHSRGPGEILETTETEDAVFENKELEIKPAIYSDSCQLPVLKIDESSLPEPAPRPLDLMQASPSIGWSLELEDHVKSVCDRTYRSFDTLLRDLVFSRNIQNDTVKARILFQWLATMKPQNLTFDSVDIGSPEETLRGLKPKEQRMQWPTTPSASIVDWFPKLYLE